MSASRPLVGLTTSWVDGGADSVRPHAVVYRAYIDALEAAGLAAVALTPAHSTEAVAALLAVCDGLVLSGGGDIEASRLGEPPHPSLTWVVPERDAMEWVALDIAAARALPVLAICRGCQVVNVHRGGTLYQDLPSQRPGPVPHDQGKDLTARTHEVRIRSGSLLHRLAGVERYATNSFHHQAVKDVAPSLEPVAWCEDGLVEAFEARGAEWLVGVQWHPERLPADAPDADPDRLLFQAFATAVRDHSAAAVAP